jgi:hypothetical protein
LGKPHYEQSYRFVAERFCVRDLNCLLRSAATDSRSGLFEAKGWGPDVTPSIDGVRAAMAGKHAAELMSQLHYSYSWYDVATVLRKMFGKIKRSPSLAKAAEKWMHEQLQRRGDTSVHYQRRIPIAACHVLLSSNKSGLPQVRPSVGADISHGACVILVAKAAKP